MACKHLSVFEVAQAVVIMSKFKEEQVLPKQRVLTCACREDVALQEDVSLQEDMSLQRSVSLVNVWCTVLTSACVVPKTASSSRASVVICKWCARKWCAIVWGRSAL